MLKSPVAPSMVTVSSPSPKATLPLVTEVIFTLSSPVVPLILPLASSVIVYESVPPPVLVPRVTSPATFVTLMAFVPAPPSMLPSDQVFISIVVFCVPPFMLPPLKVPVTLTLP